MSHYDEERAERLQSFLQSANIPKSYWQNEPSEEKVNKLARDFEELYHKFYPDRKPLLLVPANECKQKKMICTFVRPTLSPFDELFDLRGCGKFVSQYMQYEPLYDAQRYLVGTDDTVEKLPEQVVSPSTALAWQRGNSLELSLILASFLIGAGYNAYVVVGTATTATCLCDQHGELWTEELPIEPASDEEDDTPSAATNEYMALLQGRPALRAATDADPAFVPDYTPTPDGRETGRAESTASQRESIKAVHCWVAVLTGGRKSHTEATFIEPSTGRFIAPSRSDGHYTSVDSIFNHRDYYVNLSPDMAVSGLSLNLRDAMHWESLFSARDGAGEEEENLAVTAGARRMQAEVAAAAAAISSGERVSVPVSWCTELALDAGQYESRYPGGFKEVVYANATVREYAAYSQPDLRVREITVADDMLRDLTQAHIFYKHRADKLRRRVLYPLLDAANSSEGSGEGMTLRSAMSPHSPASAAQLPEFRELREYYDSGRLHESTAEGLREFIYEPGKQRTMKFYWKARRDGLAQRTELLYDASSVRKVKEVYRGRPDRLCYRSFTFTRPQTMREANLHNLILHGVGPGAVLREYPRLDPIRMSQKFERDPAVVPYKDVAKITFHRPSSTNSRGEMWVYFHYAAGSVVRPCHMYAKPSSSVDEYIAASAARKPVEPPMKMVSVPGVPEPTEVELYNERKWLGGVEAKCIIEQRAVMDECLNILLRMANDEADVQAVLSAYDTLRNRPSETEAERAKRLAEVARREESRKDYLAPYIAKLDMPSDFDGNYLTVSLTEGQAKQVRDEALQELKERLIQRGHIMQTRMDKEKEEFNTRQLAYQRSGEAASIEGDKEAEEFAMYCKEATWRMKVLDERLSKHIEHASEKYTQLAQKLSEDPRLGSLYSPDH